MSYKDYSNVAVKEPLKVQETSKPSSSTFAKSIFNDLVNTIERGDHHAKNSQKEIEEIKKIFIEKTSSLGDRSVYKSKRSNFSIHKMIIGNI